MLMLNNLTRSTRNGSQMAELKQKNAIISKMGWNGTACLQDSGSIPLISTS